MKDIFLLDVDDTLLDFKRGEREQVLTTLRKFGFAATPQAAERYHDINDALWKQLEQGTVTREQLLTLRFERLLAEFGWQGDAREINRDYFEGLSEKAYLIDGAKQFLLNLKERGRRYAVTNGSAYVQGKRTAAAGIDTLFDAAFVSERVGHNKPSPAYAAFVREHIPSFDAARAVWIGDSLTSDLPCAQALGVDFILFCPDGVPAGYEGFSARSYAQALCLIDEM